MKKYLDLEIEREHSKYPRGLKHYSKSELFENTLFDIDLIWHKVKGVWKGHENGKRNNEGSETTSLSTPKEILRGFMFRLLHANRNTESGSGEGRGIEEQYLALDEREREEHQAGDKGSDEA